MTNRITSDDVRRVTSVPEELDIEAQISIAELLVTEKLVGQGMSDARLKIIETFIAAHFVVMRMGGALLQEVRVGDAIDRYFDHYGGSLKATMEGQQAILLDDSGTLAAMVSNVETPTLPARFNVIRPGT